MTQISVSTRQTPSIVAIVAAGLAALRDRAVSPASQTTTSEAALHGVYGSDAYQQDSPPSLLMFIL